MATIFCFYCDVLLPAIILLVQLIKLKTVLYCMDFFTFGNLAFQFETLMKKQSGSLFCKIRKKSRKKIVMWVRWTFKGSCSASRPKPGPGLSKHVLNKEQRNFQRYQFRRMWNENRMIWKFESDTVSDHNAEDEFDLQVSYVQTFHVWISIAHIV